MKFIEFNDVKTSDRKLIRISEIREVNLKRTLEDWKLSLELRSTAFSINYEDHSLANQAYEDIKAALENE